MPAYNAAALLPLSLTALLRAAGDATVIVVDPGSTDGTADVARELGAVVHELGHRAGPAEARNAGVALTDADVVLFVDSDCVAKRDVVDRVREAFGADPGLVSLIGSYDATPPETSFFSQYMNLRHHHTHQIARRDGASFWAGCGAVRLSAFRAVGGFDVAQFPMPMIEDIELGLRLRSHGRMRLDPDLQVKHLKRWTMASVIRTDIFCRAVPWSRLLHAGEGLPNDLNLRLSQRLAALLAAPALLSIAATPILAVIAPLWAVLPAAIIAVSVLLNLDLVRCFARCRGAPFGAGGWAFHQVHLFYSAATFVLVGLESRLRPARSPSP
jgi:glycosyltransferase involved in cell wall biosynthesis